ncbi:leucine-rich repeat domain-containing protein, partial [Chryseobacterium sp. Alg-005]|uniref:leucine-rich repeat domain-containing protein n=1 Tax=Chryseobacterium sp. Alg-005 TaxID=3159516 RepID=UPI0036F3DD0D
MKKQILFLFTGFFLNINAQFSPPPPSADQVTESDDVKLYDAHEIPEKVFSWNVKSLMIDGEQDFREIPGKIGNLKGLINFSLKGGSVATLPKEFSGLQNIRAISINSNEFVEIPKVIFKIPGLEYFEFLSYKIDQFPNELGNLRNLKTLKLSKSLYWGGAITNDKQVFKDLYLPASIGNLKKLERLSLQSNNLKKLPSEIGNLESLIELDLSYNSLESLPTTVSKLKKLESVEVVRNKLKIFPKELYELENLKSVSLKQNMIETIPPGIEKLRNLSSLDLTGSKLSNSSLLEIYKLENLVTLMLNDG